MCRFWLRACALFAVVVVFAFSMPAQIQNGQFSGTVLDQSGAAIPNAKITVKNQATGVTFTTKSNQSGGYVVREVPAGLYSLSATAPGFKTSTLTNVNVNVGTIQRADFHMEVGQVSQTVEVSGATPPVNTEDSKLSTTVNSTQISNLPLNGRNVYDLMQLSPGAVNVTGVVMEAGHNTVVNGVREDFNGFLINGVSNKDLSGGAVNTPIQDSVQEFQQLQLNVSAQYGSSAGSVNNLITKSGTNAYHGDIWEYVRNNAFDANEYFLNQQNVANPGLHFNQFGGTIGGPIIKDKLFFFGSYQGDRFHTAGTPQTLVVESPQWEQAVVAGAPGSVAGLLYKNFPPAIAGTPSVTLNQYMSNLSGAGNSYPNGFGSLLCPNFWTTNYGSQFAGIANKLAPIVGVQANDYAGSGCTNPLPVQAGTMNRNAPFENSTVAVFGTQTQSLGNLFNGNEAMGRIDYDWNQNNRMFLNFNWLHETDSFGPCYSYCTRGFTNPSRDYFPNGQFSFIHTFSPTVLNEVRLGYTQSNTGVSTALPGVPSISILDGTAAFGSYQGYPQFFKDHEYSYEDMVSINHGNHNLKIGGDFRRNLENSQFSVARPSYDFADPFQFAADAPGFEAAGVNPGFAFGGNAQGQLETNFRHWRNWEVGAYIQDDWKTTRRLTLNLGLRWDLYTRHTEEDNLATTFLLPPGNGGIISALANANSLPGTNGCNPSNPSTVILAGVCGVGGFAPTNQLGPNHYKDFGPRVGFAYDVFGDGKTSLRGGFGLSYEDTLYNPLSNSRWNPPYYSFDETSNALLPFTPTPGTVIYGPTVCNAGACNPSGAAPTYLGAGNNVGIGTIGNQATGNINGWYPGNLDQAVLTGIVLPQGVLDPYVFNEFLSLQHEIAPGTVLEVDYVGTLGRRLFRAENINRSPGGALPAGSCLTNNVGEHICGLSTTLDPKGVPNPNYGTLRTWENSVNSSYNAMQVTLKKQMSHGVFLDANYTWSHSLDGGSTWHSGATSANGAAAGEGYTTDQTNPGLDWGNSIFDIRHRLVVNYVIQLPGQHLHGVLGAIAGGWAYNGIWAFQSGPHWEPFAGNNVGGASLVEISNPNNACTAADVNSGNCQNVGGDYNLDHGFNDRPNSSSPSLNANRNTWANGWCPGTGFGTYGCNSGVAASQSGLPVLSAPCLGCVGNLRRNQWLGPGQWYSDMGLSKTFKFTERVNLKFEAQAFNIFNRANFLLAVNGGGAHNQLGDGAFGQAAGTLNARNMQFGLKLNF